MDAALSKLKRNFSENQQLKFLWQIRIGEIKFSYIWHFWCAFDYSYHHVSFSGQNLHKKSYVGDFLLRSMSTSNNPSRNVSLSQKVERANGP